MAENDPTATEKIEAGISDALSELDSATAKDSDALKLKISYYEKLIVLNGATLALSFTAAASFHSRLVSAQTLLSLSSLRTCWLLLAISIVVSLVANWYYTVSFDHSSFFHTGNRISLRVEYLLRYSRSFLPQETIKDIDDKIPKLRLTSARSEKKASRLMFIANLLGIAAQSATFVSFYYFYLFVNANLSLS